MTKHFKMTSRLAAGQTDLECLLGKFSCMTRCVLSIPSQHIAKISSSLKAERILTSLKWWMRLAVVGHDWWFVWQMVLCAKTIKIYGCAEPFLSFFFFPSAAQVMFFVVFFGMENIYLVQDLLFLRKRKSKHIRWCWYAYNYQLVATQPKQTHNCGNDTAAKL